MPAPKNLERPESPANNVPPPSERMERNGGAAKKLENATRPRVTPYRQRLNDEVEERDNQFLRMDDFGKKTVFKEANEGSQAWRDAMKKRNQETTSERLERQKTKKPDEIDNLRNGQLNGRPRQNTVEDLQAASDIHPIAEEIRLDRANREEKQKKKNEPKTEKPAPSPSAPTRQERIADTGEEIYV